MISPSHSHHSLLTLKVRDSNRSTAFYSVCVCVCVCVCVGSDSVPSGTSLKKDYILYPLLAHNKDRRGLALDGRLKHEDTNLASSSM